MAGENSLAPSIALGWLQTGCRGFFHRTSDTLERWLERERDQLALWLPVGLGLGIAAWFALPDSRSWIAFLSAAAGLAGVGVSLAQGGRFGRSVAIFGLAACIGCALIWFRAEQVAAPRLERPLVAAFDARVESVERLPARESIRLLVAPIGAPAVPPRIRVNVETADAPAGLEPGKIVRLRARLVPPALATVPGAYDFARVAWFRGIGATGKALDPVRIVSLGEGGGFGGWIAGLRARLSAHILGQLEGAEGGVAAALAAGDQGAIPDEDVEAMRRSGLAHLLSVSGLHVTAVVAGAMFLLMRLFALSPRLALHAPLLPFAAGGAALAGIAYTLIAGAEVPTIRSCIAALLVLAGMAMGREAITLRLVAVGALVVLLIWPEALAGPSFQLSFAAVTAIVALHEHPKARALFRRREERLPVRIARIALSLLLTGLVVELALIPIALFHFHKAGIYGSIANLFAIPLTTFVIMPLEAAALLFDLVGLGAPFWWLTGQALALLLWIAHRVAAAPGAVAALSSMPWGAYAAIMAGGLWLALWRSRVRVMGVVPIVLGAAWALITPPPDLLVTGDGRHMALRSEQGGLALLRPRAGDFVRQTLGEAAAVQEEATELEALPDARCGPDLCVTVIERGGRRWRILATRSPYLVPIRAMNRACREADIVISDRRLPRSCNPRWLKVDRSLLERTGGLAINLSGPTVCSVAAEVGQHPWKTAVLGLAAPTDGLQ